MVFFLVCPIWLPLFSIFLYSTSYCLHLSSIRCRGLNPRPLGHESSALTTRPWLSINYQLVNVKTLVQINKAQSPFHTLCSITYFDYWFNVICLSLCPKVITLSGLHFTMILFDYSSPRTSNEAKEPSIETPPDKRGSRLDSAKQFWSQPSPEIQIPDFQSYSSPEELTPTSPDGNTKTHSIIL
jgi:hypothetical protein